ncbi:MAG: alpha/beta fold hydrolase [Elioraea sp.]|nr:alpha/beta fold hydrolase [Elioraea sp.]
MGEAIDLPLHYRLDGPDDGPLVVFANSLGADLHMWDEVIGRVSMRFRTLRFDKPGHGASPPAPGLTLEAIADGVVRLIAQNGGQALFVGLSIGGLIGQLLLRRAPERLSGAILIATGAHIPSPEAWEERARVVEREGLGAIVDTVMGRWFTPAFAAEEPERVSAVREAFLRVDAASYAACCRAIAKFDLRGTRPPRRVPTLVVAASEDPATPPALGEALAADLGADFMLLRRSAHMVAIERAIPVGGLVNWMQAAGARG